MSKSPLSIKNPLFIVFEGIDGSGKSTLARSLHSYLIENDVDAVMLSEPTNGVCGKKIRELLSSPITPDPDIMLSLFVDDRIEDVHNNINPALSNGSVVILDRYFYSNAAYQGASGISYKRILKANIERGFPVPDKIYYLDIPVADAISRIEARSSGNVPVDSFEKAPFLEEVASIYKMMRDEKWMILDAMKKSELLLTDVIEDLRRSFGR